MRERRDRRSGRTGAASDGGASAQTSVLGVVLLLGIVIAGMSVVAVVGGALLTDTEDSMSTARAQKVMTQFDSESAIVALGDTGVRRTELARGEDGSYSLREDAGWMNVSVTNVSSGEVTTVMNRTMGAVVYEGERANVAYQGGGVWRDDGNGSAMVSPPEFHYREETLTLPLIVVEGEGSIGDRAAIRAVGGEQTFPDPDRTTDIPLQNPLDGGKVNVTVRSEYYRAWGRFFERRTDGTARINDARGTATITLTVPPDPRTIENSVAATASGGEIDMTGTGSRSDSYTSGDGDGYAGDVHDSGTVSTAGDITIGGDAEINGSVTSGGSIDFNGGGDADEEVNGDANYTTSISSPGPDNDDHVAGTVRQIDGIETDSNINSVVDGQADELESDGTNLGAVTADEQINASTGQYYAKRIDLDSGNTLTIDATGGEVSIGVEQYVRLNDSERIEIQGTGKVRFYIEGQKKVPAGSLSYNPSGRSKIDEFHLAAVDSSRILTNTTGASVDQNATQVWFYGKDDFFGGARQSNTTGVVYAPSGTSGGSSFIASDSTDHYGGVATGYVYFDNKGAVHYDRALKNERTVPLGENVVRLTYLHVSENRLEVSG